VFLNRNEGTSGEGRKKKAKNSLPADFIIFGVVKRRCRRRYYPNSSDIIILLRHAAIIYWYISVLFLELKLKFLEYP